MKKRKSKKINTEKVKTEIEAKVFTLPEQMAIAEILHLIQQKKMEVVNFNFFSRIESSPLKPITKPTERDLNKDLLEPNIPYLQTTVSFYCRGTKVAEVVMEGYATGSCSERVLHCWRTTGVKARRYYWRDDEDEDSTWQYHSSLQHLYGGIKSGTEAEEEKFLKQIYSTLLEGAISKP